jgi:hypothetical protein
MFGVVLLTLFSAWCFATAIDLHREARRTRAKELAGDRRALASIMKSERSQCQDVQLDTSPASPTVHAKDEVNDDNEESTADLQADTEEDAQGAPMVHIYRRELGGGETLVAAVTWDGARIQWLPEDLSPELRLTLQRIVLERSGLWPGHGRVYIVGVLGALADTTTGLKWRAERPFRKSA